MTSNYATLIKDSPLLSHLSSGDMMALTGHYNRARAAERSEALKLKQRCQDLP